MIRMDSLLIALEIYGREEYSLNSTVMKQVQSFAFVSLKFFTHLYVFRITHLHIRIIETFYYKKITCAST